GVSIFALQLARAAGATILATSSSDEKLQRAAGLGADHLINYANTPDWASAAVALTGGHGVDLVVEVTGQLQAALNALASNGTVSIIGATLALAEPIAALNPRSLFSKSAVLRGISVGSVAMLRRLLAAMAASGIDPVVDKVFPFEQAREAYEALAEAKHFGKIVIKHPT
ncbi:MAG: zinc-binding dehydrogenase, partial [Alphaproteobacteria bacterium]|nr:zinc-binding dehydrogenase [Alphaproteobacteria bacterium]